MVFYKKYSAVLAIMLAFIFIASIFVGFFIKEYGFKTVAVQGSEIYKAQTKSKENNTTEKEVLLKTQYYYDIPLGSGEQDIVFELCEKYGVYPELVFAVMKVGSNYCPRMISEAGDWGIMQINEINHDTLKKELGIKDILDIEENILCGIYILSGYCKKYPDIAFTAMCYRYGEEKALEMRSAGIFSTPYTEKIIKEFKSLKFR